MMKRTQVFIIICLFGCLLNVNKKVYATETFGLVTEEMQADEIALFLNNVNISVFSIEPEKKPIKCFDVNQNGMIAIGTANDNNKMVCIYSDTGNFQYGYKFKSAGSFDIELNDDILKLYFLKSDVSVSINATGEIQNVSRICNIMENDAYLNRYVKVTNKNVGEYRYVLKNNIGILGLFLSEYSKLYQVDRLNNEKLIYEVNPVHFLYILIMFLGIIVFVSITALVMINEFEKLKKVK